MRTFHFCPLDKLHPSVSYTIRRDSGQTLSAYVDRDGSRVFPDGVSSPKALRISPYLTELLQDVRPLDAFAHLEEDSE